MHRALCAALCFFLPIWPALADMRIEGSRGGDVTEFLKLFYVLRQTGERVVIDGPCYSACTLVFNVIPRARLCVTPRAVLGFHAPRLVDREDGEVYVVPEITHAMMDAYPAPLRDWIMRHGGLRDRPIYLRGRELAAIYPRCQ